MLLFKRGDGHGMVPVDGRTGLCQHPPGGIDGHHRGDGVPDGREHRPDIVCPVPSRSSQTVGATDMSQIGHATTIGAGILPALTADTVSTAMLRPR